MEKIDGCCNREKSDGKNDNCCNHEKRERDVDTCCNHENSNATAVKIKSCAHDVVEQKVDACRNHDKLKYKAVKRLDTDQPIQGIAKEFYVDGMDCGSCALTIEKSVGNLSGVNSARVSFSTGKMNVVANTNQDFELVAKNVRRLGYQIKSTDESTPNKAESFRVEGMDCGMCALTIEKHLAKLPDVQDVSVSFTNGTMSIQHTYSVATIQEELKKLGYVGTPEHSAKSGNVDDGKKLDANSKNIFISGTFLFSAYGLSFLGLNFLGTSILFALSMIFSGSKPARGAYYALKSKSLDMNVLMVSAAIGAGIIGEWGEGALVVFLFGIGNVLQNRAIEKTRKSIKGLMDLAPNTAFVKIDGTFIEMNVANIQIGDTLLVKAGERLPLDGIVGKGTSSVDQAPVTGESIPVTKVVGDDVFAGTINQEGSLEVRVTRMSSDSTIARIIHMVEEAQEKKAPSEAFIDKFAKIYTPIVFIIAISMMVIPPVLFGGDFSEWFYKGLELLVVACPCALVISTPVSIVSAIGNAAKHGVLIKGGNFLEKAGELTTIAFDKTGTITEGKPKVTAIQVFDGEIDCTLAILAALESHTTHPIGKAIVEKANENQMERIEAEAFQNIPGKGITAKIQGIDYFAGTLALFDEGIATINQRTEVKTLQDTGHTIVLLGTKEKIIGLVAVADGIRDSSKKAIKKLAAVGISQTVMLTGDNHGAAMKIAKEAKVTDVRSNLLPEDKVRVIGEFKQNGKVVAMVGDGINDAPALALADVGIAMGGAGNDTAIETADIVLMADNLEKLPFTINLSKKSMSIIKQNIIFSVVIKLTALIFIFPGWLSLWVAVLADTGAAILVTLNALRLSRMKDD